MLAYHCRANLLLEKEFYKLTKNPLWGIDAMPLVSENFLKWQAVIRGPRDSVWEGGVFKVFLSFSDEYNFKPPEVFFHTIPFHPNVDMQTGVPCMEFLNDAECWKQFYDVAYILLQLQILLDNPVLDNPVNLEAATMLKKRPQQYMQMARDCVAASKKVEAGLKPEILSPTLYENEPEYSKDDKSMATKKMVSFEDYYRTWVNIATSKPNSLLYKPAENDNPDNLSMDESHFGALRAELEEELKAQLSDHNAIMYGRFKDRRHKDEQRIAELQATKAQLLKQMYLKEKDQDKAAKAVKLHVDLDDPADEEVDRLVSWIGTLPE